MSGPRGFAQAGNADAVMAAARAALGGDAKISAVKTFIATGRTRQVRGENLVPIEFEIQVELPDKYSRRDEFPAQDAGPVTAGFVADALVLIPRPAPPPPRPGAPAPPPGQQEAMLRGRLNAVKQDFGRLMLGMFAGSTPAFPLTYSYVGQAEAPQGKADVIDVKGPNNFAARLFIAGDTKLPIMLSWTACTGATGAPGAPAAPVHQVHLRQRARRSLCRNNDCSSPTIATSMDSSFPSASGARPVPRPPKKQPSIVTGLTRESTHDDSTRPPSERGCKCVVLYLFLP